MELFSGLEITMQRRTNRFSMFPYHPGQSAISKQGKILQAINEHGLGRH